MIHKNTVRFLVHLDHVLKSVFSIKKKFKFTMMIFLASVSDLNSETYLVIKDAHRKAKVLKTS